MALDLFEDRGHGSCSNLLSFWLYLFLLCLSRQTSHLVWSWIAGFRQSLQSPRDLASARLAWALRRCISFRSGVWGLFCSYFRPFSALASTFFGFGSGWRSVCRVFGVAFLLGFLTFGFQRGSCTGGSLSFRGPLPAFCGLGNGKVYSKVRPIARGSGAGPDLLVMVSHPTKSSPRLRGNRTINSPKLGIFWVFIGLSPRLRGLLLLLGVEGRRRERAILHFRGLARPYHGPSGPQSEVFGGFDRLGYFPRLEAKQRPPAGTPVAGGGPCRRSRGAWAPYVVRRRRGAPRRRIASAAARKCAPHARLSGPERGRNAAQGRISLSGAGKRGERRLLTAEPVG